MSLGVSVYGAVGAVLTGAPSDGTNQYELEADLGPLLFEDGAASQLYAATRTLAASANETLSLTASLLDGLGNSLTFADVKGVLIRPAKTNTSAITIGGASHACSAPFAGGSPQIEPGGAFLAVNPLGWTVVASSSDEIKVTNDDSVNPATYTIVIFG